MKFLKSAFPYALIGCSLIFIGVGLYRGEVLTLFEKAIAICLECVGIG